MSNAVKRISVERGHDVTDYVLTTFGGAGGQHACAVADSLGIRTVLIPPMAGVLSALGIGLADTTVMREQAVEAPLEPQTVDRVGEIAASLESIARAELAAEGVPDERVRVVARAHLRYDGPTTPSLSSSPTWTPWWPEFEARYRTTTPSSCERPLIVEAVSVEATGLTPQPDLTSIATIDQTMPDARPETVRLWAVGGWRDAPLLRSRADALPGRRWQARRSSPRPTPRPSSTTVGGRR